jgi:16S rRNA (cytosine1402-N4)-methyltransferase
VGFSFRFDAPLDMRMDPTTGQLQPIFFNNFPEAEIARNHFRVRGKSDTHDRIARRIVRTSRTGAAG